MKIKTSEMTGITLDWAVAKCEESLGLDNAERFLRDHRIGFTTRYSANWSQGGPIFEREKMSVGPAPGARPVGKAWLAGFPCNPESLKFRAHGPTPLIAAMRCYVASKLGDAVDVPEELMK